MQAHCHGAITSLRSSIRPFAPHIFPQSSQNLIVILPIDSLTRCNKLFMHNSSNGEEEEEEEEKEEEKKKKKKKMMMMMMISIDLMLL